MTRITGSVPLADKDTSFVTQLLADFQNLELDIGVVLGIRFGLDTDVLQNLGIEDNRAASSLRACPWPT